jgi:serine/threonine protein kinase
MIGKRETSMSVTDLQDFHNVNESIKRLAISIDGHPSKSHSGEETASNNNVAVMSETTTDARNNNSQGSNIPTDVKLSQSAGPPIQSILSNARADFGLKYELLKEIGRGGFSTVYQCRDRLDSVIYAVKVVDLRPLRLRERFNPSRLRREVDIMRRLKHPNIIQFVDVFETSDQLMMIMEYCPGDELFDVILARKFFLEKDAKPIFAQICRALFYLHSLNIIHRDIKPENVLIMRSVDPITGEVTAKLLDFGLSKNAGAGSSAKTFVGTPCYLAPEVEYTSKGLGGTYGLPADCWSLGAVLYVMLVARFPEFEQDASGKVLLRLPPALWDDVSSDAKALIRLLMNTNPDSRLTVGQALQHPWLAEYRVNQEELTSIALSCSDFSQGLQDEEEALSISDKNINIETENEITAGGISVQRQQMVLRNHNRGNNNVGSGERATDETDQLALRPLLHLQRSIADCFREAHESYADIPEVAMQIRKGAALCRQQLMESTKMLRKVEQTACAVLDMFPDLELAVEEGEPQLASAFFNMVRGWVVELRALVNTTQEMNKASMNQIQIIVEQSTIGLQHRIRSNNVVDQLSQKLIDMIQLQQTNNSLADATLRGAVGGIAKGESNLSADQVLELFLSLFGQQTQPLAIRDKTNDTTAQQQKTSIFDNIHPNYHESIPFNLNPPLDRTDSPDISDRVQLASNTSSPYRDIKAKDENVYDPLLFKGTDDEEEEEESQKMDIPSNKPSTGKRNLRPPALNLPQVPQAGIETGNGKPPRHDAPIVECNTLARSPLNAGSPIADSG